MRRTDEQSYSGNRSIRFVEIDGKWYFKSREEVLLGPYFSLEEAYYGVDVYIALVRSNFEDVA